MLIDFLTGRYFFTDFILWISIPFYCTAALTALLLRRWGQARVAKKYGRKTPRFPDLWLQDLTSSLWAAFFFLMTGCIKGPLREEDLADDTNVRRKTFFAGILFPFLGAVASLLLYLILSIFSQWTYIEIPMLFAKALTCANLSLVIFSLLPLPLSDAEQLLRDKDFGEKGTAFRKQGTYPFLVFTLVGLLLGCVTVSIHGVPHSLSSVLTLFPFLLIGG